MQGTVRYFDEASRSGTVLLDDGTELAYDTAAFDAGGLRLLRIGQRVALRVAALDDGAAEADTAASSRGAPRVTAITLVTLPLPGTAPARPSKP
jgi:2-phospho-L-lactate guanylyltransferase